MYMYRYVKKVRFIEPTADEIRGFDKGGHIYRNGGWDEVFPFTKNDQEDDERQWLCPDARGDILVIDIKNYGLHRTAAPHLISMVTSTMDLEQFWDYETRDSDLMFRVDQADIDDLRKIFEAICDFSLQEYMRRRL